MVEVDKKGFLNVGHPKRASAPALTALSGRQHAQAAAKEAARSVFEKLSQDRATVMMSLYAKI